MAGSGEKAMREKMLYEASLRGCVESLNELLQEDRLVVARSSLTWFDDSPLHIAALLGHKAFAEALLYHKPDLAAELNLQGQSALHVAAAAGQAEIVKALLKVNPEVCLVCDEDGMAPLHLAIKKGRAAIARGLVQAQHKATELVLDQGMTVLHLCVMYNRLETLKAVLEEWTRGEEFLNVEDDNGNTILHLAAMLKRVEIIKYLLERTGVKLNALNRSRLTPLDIVEHMPRDYKAMEIQDLLRKVGSNKTNEITPVEATAKTTRSNTLSHRINMDQEIMTSTVPEVRQTKQGHHKTALDKHKWVENMRNAWMVTATVIASMAYQAGLSPPCGVWQENSEYQLDFQTKINVTAGKSILAVTDEPTYITFLITNTISFVTSLSMIFLLVSGLPIKKKIMMWILKATMWMTIAAMAFTYYLSMSAITPDYSHGIAYMMGASVWAWMLLIGFNFLGHTCRFIYWIIRSVKNWIQKKASFTGSSEV
ncbi:hypothetical protein NMG60_11022027 [Bertholletia excelsa]